MKLTAQHSVKFNKIKRRLSLKHWQVVGLLESLWLLTQGNAPRGDIGKMSNEDIAAAIEWEGPADDLIWHLVECGLIDECIENRLVIHDWIDHIPTYLKGALSKNGVAICTPKPPSQHPAIAGCYSRVLEHGAKQPAKQPAEPSQQPAPYVGLGSVGLGSVAEPRETLPVEDSSTSGIPKSSASNKSRNFYSPAFEAFWEVYPRKEAKADAAKAFEKASRTVAVDVLIEKAAEFASSPKGQSGQFCPQGATWLNGCRWKDDPKVWQVVDKVNGSARVTPGSVFDPDASKKDSKHGVM